MFKNEWNQVRSGWLIAFALLMVFFGQMIFTMPGATLWAIVQMSQDGAIHVPENMDDMSPLYMFLTQGIGTVGGIAATLVVFRAVNKKNPNKLGLQGRARDMVYGLFLGAATMTVIFFILLATNQITLLTPLSQPVFSNYTLAFMVIFILVGFFEEMFFRGYIMQTMIERGNKRWLIYLVSAVVFGLAHITNPNVTAIGILNIMLVGLLFAYMFERTKSLMLPIGFHITWNFFQGSVYGFAVSGMNPHGLYTIDMTKGNELFTGGTFGVEGGLMTTLLIIVTFFLTQLYTEKRVTKSGTLLHN